MGIKKKKEPDLFWKEWTETWDNYCLQITGKRGVFSGEDVKGLKQIRAYFLRNTNKFTGALNTEEEALNCFKYILKKRDSLPKFYQSMRPVFIYSHLLDIISHLRVGGKVEQLVNSTEEAKQRNFKRNL